MMSGLLEVLAELRAIRRALEGQHEQWVSWAEAIRRIGGNRDDAEQLLLAAIAAGRVKTLTVARSGRRRVWSPDLANVAPPRQGRRRGSKRGRLTIGE
jgi:hypothetical protein